MAEKWRAALVLWSSNSKNAGGKAGGKRGDQPRSFQGKCPLFIIKVRVGVRPRKTRAELTANRAAPACCTRCVPQPPDPGFTTAHRRGLEKLGKRGQGAGALPSLRLRLPLCRIACIKTRDGPTAICTVPQAASRAAALVPLATSARVGGRVAEKWRAAMDPRAPQTRKAGRKAGGDAW